jgi:hypothetical protein
MVNEAFGFFDMRIGVMVAAELPDELLAVMVAPKEFACP